MQIETYRVGCVRVDGAGLTRRVFRKRFVPWEQVRGFAIVENPAHAPGEPPGFPEYLLVATLGDPTYTPGMTFGEFRKRRGPRRDRELTVCVLGEETTVLTGPKTLPWRKWTDAGAARLMADMTARGLPYTGRAERRRWVEWIWARHGRDATGALASGHGVQP